ncbi:anoctamin-5-like isoform X2 [Petromyzon marinus]|uniref:anoctamin-5-like isoform X2 n=1 Tax=Petromyzon marinus TaxID=7757 RepID=UPI003F6E50B4
MVATRLLTHCMIEEICNSFSEILVMCPQCDKRCTFWRLNETCDSAKSSSIYENPDTVFFTIFMGLWATVFLEIWKRYQTSLALRWDLTEEEGDPIRPEYEARCTSNKLNIITMVIQQLVGSVSGQETASECPYAL